MDGLLVVDKPVGPTSHDVVTRVRRALGERRVGHTGTLDPGASGVLPLVVGRATRLAQFLSAGDKQYEAAIRLGQATDTGDAAGALTGRRYTGLMPAREAIERALDAFRGAFLQRPPAYSAKKIAGRRSYDLARAHARRQRSVSTGQDPAASPAPPAPPAVSVVAHALTIVGVEDDIVRVRLDCSAGFYVRSLAHDLGEALGTGAHLLALRRTRSADARIEDALTLEAIEAPGGREKAMAVLVPPGRMLPSLSAVTLTAEGAWRARHGRDLGPLDAVDFIDPTEGTDGGAGLQRLRLLDAGGELLALGEPASTPGLLHPFVVLV